MNDLFDFLMGQQGGQYVAPSLQDRINGVTTGSLGQGSGADYGYSPVAGMPNNPEQQNVYQPPLNSMLPGFSDSSQVTGGGWRPQAARVPRSTLGIGEQTALPYPPSVDRPAGGWRPQSALLPGTSVNPVDPSQVYQPPLNSMLPGYSQPNMAAASPMTSSGFVGPSYDQEAQSQYAQSPYAGPMMDRSVDGSMNSTPRGDPWGGIQGSPYAVISDSMGSSDPVHVLGVNGFRTGSSSPFVDYSGPMARQQAVRNNMNISDILGRQDAIRNSHNLDLQKMMIMSADRQDSIHQRRQSDFDRNFMKLPLGRKRGAIDEGERMGTITPEAAQAARLEDTIDAGFMATGMNKDKRPNDLEKFMREVSVRFDPNKMSRAEFINKLIGMGYKADDIKALKDKPGLEQFVPSLLGPDSVVNNAETDRQHWQRIGLGPLGLK